MRYTTFFISMLFAFYSVAQNCQISEDSFSKKKQVIFDFRKGTIKYELNGDRMWLQIKAGYSGNFDYPIEKGTPILFKFNNNETLELNTMDDSTPNTSVMTIGNQVVAITNYYYRLPLSREIIQRFSENDVTIIRYPDATGGTQDLEGKRIKKFAKALKKGANCISENLQ